MLKFHCLLHPVKSQPTLSKVEPPFTAGLAHPSSRSILENSSALLTSWKWLKKACARQRRCIFTKLSRRIREERIIVAEDGGGSSAWTTDERRTEWRTLEMSALGTDYGEKREARSAAAVHDGTPPHLTSPYPTPAVSISLKVRDACWPETLKNATMWSVPADRTGPSWGKLLTRDEEESVRERAKERKRECRGRDREGGKGREGRTRIRIRNVEKKATFAFPRNTLAFLLSLNPADHWNAFF